MDDIICLYTTLDSTEADLIKAQLESAEIPCYLNSDNAGGAFAQLSLSDGIKIMIRQEDLNQATKIMNDRLT